MLSAGSAATQLGANADATADLFGDWGQYLGMSELQVGSIAQHMRVVQKETGISGDDMIQLAKASESVFKNLRK